MKFIYLHCGEETNLRDPTGRRYRRGHEFKSRTGLNFFSGSIFNYYFSSVLSCEDLLNCFSLVSRLMK